MKLGDVYFNAGYGSTNQAQNGIHLTLEDDILPNFIPDDGEIHGAPTKLICLENTLHGMVFPWMKLKKFLNFAKRMMSSYIWMELDYGMQVWQQVFH